MAEKLIKTKIKLLTRSLEDWMGSHATDVLLKGEIGICEIPSGNATATTAPTVLFKVGDGTLPYHNSDPTKCLKWASALAADVYDWAKKSLDEFTVWVAKTPKTVTLTVNNIATDYSIEDAIKLVRGEIAAGGTAAALTIADQSQAGKIKYVAQQGGIDIVEAIEIDEGTGIDITVNATSKVPVISHQAKPTTGNAVTATTDTATGNTFITEVAIDSLGHVAGVKSKTVTIPDSPSITITDKTNTDTDNLVYAVTNLVESGTLNHTITPTYKAVPTKKYVDDEIAAKVAGAVQYLGTISTAANLGKDSDGNTITVGKGDFYRVTTEIKNGSTILAFVGDLVVAEKDNPSQAIDGTNWTAIHCGDGDISNVAAGNGLTGGGSTGSVTLSAKAGNHITVDTNGIHHGAKPTTGTAQSATAGTGRTYVTEVLVDSYGHIAGVKTATENVTNTDTWRNINVFAGVEGSKASVSLKGTGITTGALNLKAGTGLKWTATANSNDATVDIDDTVTFILDCN